MKKALSLCVVRSSERTIQYKNRNIDAKNVWK